MLGTESLDVALNLGGTDISPPGQKSPRAKDPTDSFSLVFVPVFVFVLVLVLQQAATYSIAAVAGN